MSFTEGTDVGDHLQGGTPKNLDSHCYKKNTIFIFIIIYSSITQKKIESFGPFFRLLR